VHFRPALMHFVTSVFNEAASHPLKKSAWSVYAGPLESVTFVPSEIGY